MTLPAPADIFGCMRMRAPWKSMLLAAALLAGGAEEGPQRVRTARGDAASVPLAAQGLISRTLGRDDGSYHARSEADGLAFQNRRHRLEARFASGRVEVRSGRAQIGFSLREVGYGEARTAVPSAQPQGSANRVEYRRGALGLEQGFTLAAAPARKAAGPLTLALEISGIRGAEVHPMGDALTFTTDAGAIRYRGLTAFDADGRELPARMQMADGTLLLRVDDDGARYPVTIDPFVEQAMLVASDADFAGAPGSPLAVSGDTIVVGAPADYSPNFFQGSAYVFVRPASGWGGTVVQQAKLTASDGWREDFFGTSVAVSGDTVVVGAP